MYKHFGVLEQVAKVLHRHQCRHIPTSGRHQHLATMIWGPQLLMGELTVYISIGECLTGLQTVLAMAWEDNMPYTRHVSASKTKALK